MTPLQIEILFHYHTRSVDYRDGDLSAPAVRQAIDHFKKDGWLEVETSSTLQRSYRTTEKTEVYLKALLETPEPIQVWVMP